MRQLQRTFQMLIMPAFCTLISIWGTVSANDSVTINVGGPRRAIVVIDEAEEAYQVKVSMVPVRAFDAGMNRRLSHEKARSYAVEALFRHLRRGKKVSATIGRFEVVEADFIDNRFVLSLSVPRNSVRLADGVGGDPVVKPQKAIPRLSIVKSKNDFRDTLEIIVQSLADELPKADGKIDSFYAAVSDAEDLAVTRFASLRSEVKADRWLLSTERDELLAKVASEEELFLSGLRKLVLKVEARDKDEARNDP